MKKKIILAIVGILALILIIGFGREIYENVFPPQRPNETFYREQLELGELGRSIVFSSENLSTYMKEENEGKYFLLRLRPLKNESVLLENITRIMDAEEYRIYYAELNKSGEIIPIYLSSMPFGNRTMNIDLENYKGDDIGFWGQIKYFGELPTLFIEGIYITSRKERCDLKEKIERGEWFGAVPPSKELLEFEC